MFYNKIQQITIILKDLNKFPTPQLVYNQMWLNLLMDDYHFNNIAKIIINFVPNHIGENKNLQFFKKWTYFT